MIDNNMYLSISERFQEIMYFLRKDFMFEINLPFSYSHFPSIISYIVCIIECDKLVGNDCL